MYAKECPELILDVPRVEEKHKYHKHRTLFIHLQEKGEIHLLSMKLERKVSKDI